MWHEGDIIQLDIIHLLKFSELYADTTTKYNVQFSVYFDSAKFVDTNIQTFDDKKSEILEQINNTMDDNYSKYNHIYTDVQLEKSDNKKSKIILTCKYKTEHTLLEILHDIIEFTENTGTDIIDSELLVISVSN